MVSYVARVGHNFLLAAFAYITIVLFAQVM
jgi:hypothetical protein